MVAIGSNGMRSAINGFDSLNSFDTAYIRTRSSRIRGAMFPEIEQDDVDDDDQEAQTSSAATFSIIGMLAEPSQALKNAVVDLLHVQDDNEAAWNALPELIRRLGDRDPAVVAQAAHMIYVLSKQPCFLSRLATRADVIDALVRAAANMTDERAKGTTAATLSQISSHAEGRLHIFRSGGIAELIRMLRSPVDSVVHYAVTTLHNLLLYLESAKQEVIAHGGLEALTPLLRSSNPKLQALVADSLYFVLLDRPECKKTFLALQGPHQLVTILVSNRGYMKLLYAVIRCIRSIGTSAENKACLIGLGTLEALHDILPLIVDPKRRLALLQAMRNLSDAATNLQTLQPLILDLLAIVNEDSDEEIVSCACGILSNLTCNNALNKQTVVKNVGMPIITQALNRFPHIEDITEPALCTMRHCTARHPMALKAQDDVRDAYAHSIILALLATRRTPIVKAALGLVRNCALSDINLQSIIAEVASNGDTVTSIAIEVLERSAVIVKHNINALEDGVSILEMVEGAVASLHQLARDERVAHEIYSNPQLMTVLVDLLSNEQINSNEDDLMMREILGLIYQLTKSPQGAQSVEAHGPTPYIVDALHSPSKPIVAYASIILKNMGVNKPLEYQRRLRRELVTPNGGVGVPDSQHTNQGYSGEAGWMNDGMEPELFNEMYNYASLAELQQTDAMTSPHNGSWYDTDL